MCPHRRKWWGGTGTLRFFSLTYGTGEHLWTRFKCCTSTGGRIRSCRRRQQMSSRTLPYTCRFVEDKTPQTSSALSSVLWRGMSMFESGWCFQAWVFFIFSTTVRIVDPKCICFGDGLKSPRTSILKPLDHSSCLPLAAKFESQHWTVTKHTPPPLHPTGGTVLAGILLLHTGAHEVQLGHHSCESGGWQGTGSSRPHLHDC